MPKLGFKFDGQTMLYRLSIVEIWRWLVKVGDLVKPRPPSRFADMTGLVVGSTNAPDVLLVLWQDGRTIPTKVVTLEVISESR